MKKKKEIEILRQRLYAEQKKVSELNDKLEQQIANKQTLNGWRLPTIDELMVMFDRKRGKPTIEGFIFYYYWSSTTYEGNKRYAWGINFGYGNVYNGTKDDGGYVRCVRDGKDGLKWSKSSENAMTWKQAIDYAKQLKE